jgi:hypothetical protein
MRRTLVGIAAAVILVVANVGAALASDPVEVSIRSATLVANGAAVDVTYDVVCQPYIDSTQFTPDMGSGVRVDQAVSKKAMTHASADPYGNWFTCDGTTVNTVTMRLVPETIPFKKGPALVSVRLRLVEYMYYWNETGQASTTVKIR